MGLHFVGVLLRICSLLAATMGNCVSGTLLWPSQIRSMRFRHTQVSVGQVCVGLVLLLEFFLWLRGQARSVISAFPASSQPQSRQWGTTVCVICGTPAWVRRLSRHFALLMTRPFYVRLVLSKASPVPGPDRRVEVAGSFCR